MKGTAMSYPGSSIFVKSTPLVLFTSLFKNRFKNICVNPISYIKDLMRIRFQGSLVAASDYSFGLNNIMRDARIREVNEGSSNAICELRKE
jgi:hypothetical protein